MIIEPMPNHVQIERDAVVIGGLDTSSKDSAIELGTIKAKGSDVKLPVSVGDKIFYKGWGVDIVTHGEDTYYFIDTTNNSILARATEE